MKVETKDIVLILAVLCIMNVGSYLFGYWCGRLDELRQQTLKQLFGNRVSLSTIAVLKKAGKRVLKNAIPFSDSKDRSNDEL